MGDDENLTGEEKRDDSLTQPLPAEALRDPEVEPLSEEQLAQENAESSLDQPSDSTS
ncbi:MAG: hypothetical protein ACJ72O_04725 [Marmoricola sp.]